MPFDFPAPGSCRLLFSLIALTLGIGLVAPPATAQTAPPAIEGYRDYAAMTARLRHYAEEHPDLVRLRSVGKTLGGRDIWMVEVAEASGTPVAERPALLVAAGFEGNQLAGSEQAVEVIHYLIHGFEEGDEDVTRRLREAVFYFFPRVNPDAAERMFARVRTGSRLNGRPFDDDNDGRADEDAPDDLNGDGLVTLMRVPDPAGPYRIDPKDPRLMVKADASKGEAGGFALYLEGTDDDGDGFYNEDGPGGVDLGRNFQHEYPYYTRGAGPHMVSEPESRAVMDFAIAHRNIAAVLVWGEHDNLVEPPNQKGEWPEAKPVAMEGFADASFAEALTVGMMEPPRPRFFRGFGRQEPEARTGRPSSGRRPETTVNKDDLAYFTTVSERYRELTGLKSTPATRKPEGTFAGYAYYQYGVPAFETPGWAPAAADSAAADSTAPGARPRPGQRSPDRSIDGRLLTWMDAAGIDGFAAWSAHDHPTLGAVEIGGFKPYQAYNPPFAVIQEQTPGQGAFAVYLASLFARVRIADVTVTDLGGGIFRIEADVENAGYLPTALAHGVVARSVKPTMVQLGIDPDELVSGSDKTSFFQALDGSGRREEFEWIVRGGRGDTVDLRVVSQKGGSDTRRITLQ
jgi:hypothetical protein